jgi:hypothetical protein
MSQRKRYRTYRIPVSIRVPATAYVEGKTPADARARFENMLDSGVTPWCVNDPELSQWSDLRIEGDANEEEEEQR